MKPKNDPFRIKKDTSHLELERSEKWGKQRRDRRKRLDLFK